MKETKEVSLAEYKPRDLGLISQRNFGVNLARGERGILSYGIHFNGKDFIDPHSSLVLGRLYGARFTNRLHSSLGSDDWYTLLWCDKSEHNKVEKTPWARREYYNDDSWLGRAALKVHHHIADTTQAALEFGLALKSNPDKELGHDRDERHVWRLDATECRSIEGYYPNKRQRVNDIEGYEMARSHHPSINVIKGAFGKARRAVKYTLVELGNVERTVSELFYHCMTMQTTIPDLKPPDKLMTKVVGKMLGDDSQHSYMKDQARSVLEMCDIMSDPDKIKEHSTLII